MKASLLATKIIDCVHPEIVSFVDQHIYSSWDDLKKAVSLYEAVRDNFYYDPYRIDFTAAGLKASHTLKLGYGWCVSKAILLTACCRAAGIPSNLGFADVKNHLSTEKLTKAMKTDVFYWHGYSVIYLEGKWVKATPAFNKELCEKFHIKPLKFDGKQDSIYHPFTETGDKHMEYLQDRGVYSDVPMEAMMETYQQQYGGILQSTTKQSFIKDVESEQNLSVDSL